MEAGSRFSRCLLDRKDEEGRNARCLRRRTLLLSILIQALILTLLMLKPLFGAEDLVLVARFVPLPPWKGQPGPPANAPHHSTTHHPHRGDIVPGRIYFDPHQRPASHEQDSGEPEIGLTPGPSDGGGLGDPNGLIRTDGLTGPNRPSPPPQDEQEPPRKPRFVPSEIQQALLVVRVEPLYPIPARQARIEGTVQIRAIIAKDGSVQSLEILSGNALLARAAQDAVLKWRYRPTLLNGKPVEVETLITVQFWLNH